MLGVMLRNVLKPTLLTTSAVSRKSEQRGREVRARKSSIRRVPMLYPLSSERCQFRGHGMMR